MKKKVIKNLLILKWKIKYFLRVVLKKNIQFEISEIDYYRLVNNEKLSVIIQIGSNDGLKNDPLNKIIKNSKSNVFLIEPDPINFKKLCNNIRKYPMMRESFIKTFNIGITEVDDLLPFYRISNITEDDPDWYDQVGSFDENTFDMNISVIENLNKRKEIVELNTLSFENFCINNGIKSVDFLHVDTEGYDYKILQTIDFNKYNVKIILFEADWMKCYELRLITQKLQVLGFEIYKYGIDMLCIRK